MTPKWPKESSKLLASYAEAYKESLKSVATGIAERAESEFVGKRHIADADRILQLCERNRIPWFARPETEISGSSGIFVARGIFRWNLWGELVSLC